MKRTKLEIESDVTLIVEFLKMKYQVKNNFYGDTYPKDVTHYMHELESITDKDQYKAILEKIMICFKTYI